MKALHVRSWILFYLFIYLDQRQISATDLICAPVCVAPSIVNRRTMCKQLRWSRRGFHVIVLRSVRQRGKWGGGGEEGVFGDNMKAFWNSFRIPYDMSFVLNSILLTRQWYWRWKDGRREWNGRQEERRVFFFIAEIRDARYCLR